MFCKVKTYMSIRVQISSQHEYHFDTWIFFDFFAPGSPKIVKVIGLTSISNNSPNGGSGNSIFRGRVDSHQYSDILDVKARTGLWLLECRPLLRSDED